MSAQDDTNTRGLTGRQAIAAGALIMGHTHAEAAELAQVSRSTVSRWAQDDTFGAAVEVGSASVMRACVDTIAAASAEALATMLDLMRGDNVYLKYNAAKWILDAASRYAGMGTAIAEDTEIVIRWADGESWRDGLNWEDRQWGQSSTD